MSRVQPSTKDRLVSLAYGNVIIIIIIIFIIKNNSQSDLIVIRWCATYDNQKLVGLTGNEYTFDQLRALKFWKIFSEYFNVAEKLLKSVGLEKPLYFDLYSLISQL